MTDKKYNYVAKRITCPLCGVKDLGVRETGRIYEHMPGVKGLRVTASSRLDLGPMTRGPERCGASGKTEAEAAMLHEKQNHGEEDQSEGGSLSD